MDSSSQFFELIFFALIAVFLVLRLRGILGRRDGSDGSHKDPFRPNNRRNSAESEANGGDVVAFPLPPDQQDTVPPAAREQDTETTADVAGLTEIKLADSNFTEAQFLAGAQMAFEAILEAFAEGNRKVLKPLLNKEVFADFDAVLKEREDTAHKDETSLVGFRRVEIIEAWMEGRMAHITVKFVSDQINLVRDTEGRVIDGDPHAVVAVTDIWTFARDIGSRDPNWILVATSDPD